MSFQVIGRLCYQKIQVSYAVTSWEVSLDVGDSSSFHDILSQL